MDGLIPRFYLKMDDSWSREVKIIPTWANDSSILYVGTVMLSQLIQQFTSAL
jgi:hypothetical protein